MKQLTFWAVAIALVLTMGGMGFAADTNTLSVSANVVGTCKFNVATSTLPFGALDPTSAADATASGSVTFWCTNGASFTVSDDDGLYETGVNANRMRHATDVTQFIPYGLTLSPTTGTGTGPSTPITLTIDGLISNANYVNAMAGDYADTVVITVSP
jgi:spore coat protein U-like protein